MVKIVLFSMVILSSLVLSCGGSSDDLTPIETVREYIYAVSKADTDRIEELRGENAPIYINDIGSGYDIEYQNIDIKLTFLDEYKASVTAEFYLADRSSGMILPEDYRYYSYGLEKKEGQWVIKSQVDLR